MLTAIKMLLGAFLAFYLFLVIDAFLIGSNKFDEKVLDYSFIQSRSRGSANRYWMITEKGKINVDYDLYASLKPEKVIQTYRSKVFGHVLKIDSQVGNFLRTHNVCFTRTTSGLSVISLFSIITFISLIRIDRVYRNGQIGLTILLTLLFLITLYDHLY